MIDNDKIKSESLYQWIKPTINLRILTTSVFLVLAIIFFFWEKVGISIMVSILLIVWTLEQFLSYLLIKIQKKEYKINNIFFCQFIFDVLILTAIVYYIGTIEWIGAIFYIFTIIYSSFFISEMWKRLFLILLVPFLFFGLTFLEYFKIIPFRGVFFNNDLYNNLYYVLTTVSLVGGAFILISITINIFAGILRSKIKELDNIQKKLNESKINLEDKVKLRTKELKKLTANLEEEVQKRTEELEKKVNELERFSKLTVDREIKMIELKEEIKKLKNK